jgi:4-amino-4-deoxy-L-arabinose transferase-like glycosyltransferase
LKFHKNIFSILAIGLILRLLPLIFFWGKPLTIVDETHYQAIAENILRHQEFALETGHSTSIRPPLYPAFLTAIYSVTGGVHLNAVRMIQILISLGIIYVIYRLALRLFDEKVGRVAALIFAVYPSLIVFSHFVLTEILFTFLFLVFVYFFVAFLQHKKYLDIFLTGLFLGLAALTRSILYPFMVITIVFMAAVLRDSFANKTKWTSLLIAGCLLVTAPWSIRNTMMYGSLVAVDTMGGLNMYMGNYEHTPLNRAWAAVDLQGDKAWYYGHEQALSGMNEAQKQKWATKQAATYMSNHKLLTLERTLIKAANLWGLEREVLGVIINGHYPELNKKAALLVTTPAIFLSYCIVIVGSVFGLCHNMNLRNFGLVFLMLIMIYFTGVHALTFGHSRYHLPLIPLLGIFASWSLLNFRAIWCNRNSLRFKLSLASSAGFLLIWFREVILVEGSRYLSNF